MNLLTAIGLPGIFGGGGAAPQTGQTALGVGVQGISSYPTAGANSVNDLNRPSTTSLFRVEKIANGFIVHLAKHEGAYFEKHYTEDMNAVGNLVTASLARWALEGSK